MKTKPKTKRPAAKAARKGRPAVAAASKAGGKVRASGKAQGAPAEEKESATFQPDEYKVEDPAPRQELRWVEVECPYCGETFDVRVDPGEEGQSLVQDCQVCCKPVQLSVDIEDGEISIFAARG
jgi:hypothetical protein